jgi:hypothetical protein
MIATESKEQKELIIELVYSNGDQRQTLCVCGTASAEMIEMFRFELRESNREGTLIRFETSDVYAMQRRFVERVVELYDDGWKRERIYEAEPNVRYLMQHFDPRLFCAAEKPEWVLRGIPLIREPVQTNRRDLPVNIGVTMTLMTWSISLPLLVWLLRHFVPIVYVFVAPILFSLLISLAPDRELLRRVRIGWRVLVIVTGILYSGLLVARR